MTWWRSRSSLNDHWKDMLEYQFVNNRIFDALACGLPVISDVSDELRELCPQGVLYYESREEFEQAVDRVLHHYEEVKAEVDGQWERIRREFSFETRTAQLIALAKKYAKRV